MKVVDGPHTVLVCVCVCVCACARACVRACAYVCVTILPYSGFYLRGPNLCELCETLWARRI